MFFYPLLVARSVLSKGLLSGLSDPRCVLADCGLANLARAITSVLRCNKRFEMYAVLRVGASAGRAIRSAVNLRGFARVYLHWLILHLRFTPYEKDENS